MKKPVQISKEKGNQSGSEDDALLFEPIDYSLEQNQGRLQREPQSLTDVKIVYNRHEEEQNEFAGCPLKIPLFSENENQFLLLL